MKRLLLIFLLLSQPTLALDEWSGKVVGVSDGDTISVMHNGKAEKIRLYGIDCPESKQDFGRRAKEFTSDMVIGKVVTITAIDTDRYGRTVALVDIDGESLNRAHLVEGMACVYIKYCKIPECAEWKELEKAAREAKVGLWVQPNPVPPWEWRKEKKKKSQR